MFFEKTSWVGQFDQHFKKIYMIMPRRALVFRYIMLILFSPKFSGAPSLLQPPPHASARAPPAAGALAAVVSVATGAGQRLTVAPGAAASLARGETALIWQRDGLIA